MRDLDEKPDLDQPEDYLTRTEGWLLLIIVIIALGIGAMIVVESCLSSSQP